MFYAEFSTGKQNRTHDVVADVWREGTQSRSALGSREAKDLLRSPFVATRDLLLRWLCGNGFEFEPFAINRTVCPVVSFR